MGTSATEWLYASLALRETPETVAKYVAEALAPDSSAAARKLALKISRKTVSARIGWSSMATRFRGADPMDRQVAKARELADLFLDARLPGSDDVEELETFIDSFNTLIGKSRGHGSFRYGRLNRATRAELGLQLSRRRYDKLFRMAARLEKRLKAYKEAIHKNGLVLVGKAGLVEDIRREDLMERPWTASFIAYYTARLKLRSEFTIEGQQKAFDELSMRLLKGCETHEDANWFAIAHVFPRADVLARLTDEQKGRLLGRWFGVLHRTADRLRVAFEKSHINLESMIVKKGDDSSTWNTFAGAWNRARDHWISLIVALGMERTFEAMLPGKVMRLMAADVAAWHRISGGDIHPDTKIWRDLPKPWLVLTGHAYCNLHMVEEACERHGVEKKGSGWCAPRPRTTVATYRPTPELVHGVTVENPYFAKFLRKLGAFSGKELKLEHLHEILEAS